MLNTVQLLDFLKDKEIPVAGSVVRDPLAQNQYFVFVSIRRDNDNKQIPSNRKLKEIQSQLADLGTSIEFLLTDTLTQDIEAGLRATLLLAFGDDLRNVFLSLDGRSAHLWIDLKRQLDDEVLKSINIRAKNYLDQLDIALASISNISGHNLPSILVCLKVIRIHAPIDLPTLRSILSERKFNVPSDDWLARRLDSMRRSAKVVRLDNGNYVLSLESIRNLGAGRGRESPDIVRMLALAQQKK